MMTPFLPTSPVSLNARSHVLAFYAEPWPSASSQAATPLFKELSHGFHHVLSGTAGGESYGGTAESVRMSSLPLWQLEPKDYG